MVRIANGNFPAAMKALLVSELDCDRRIDAGLLASLAFGLLCSFTLAGTEVSSAQAFLCAAFFMTLLGVTIIGFLSQRVLLPASAMIASLVLARTLFALGLRMPSVLLLLAFSMTFMLAANLLGGSAAKGWRLALSRWRTGPRLATTNMPILDSASRASFTRALRDPINIGMDSALADYINGLQCDPNGSPSPGSQAIVLAKAGRIDEAIAELASVVKKNPTDTGALFHLAMILSGKQRHSEALKAFVAFVARSGRSDPEHVKFAKARISDLKLRIDAA